MIRSFSSCKEEQGYGSASDHPLRNQGASSAANGVERQLQYLGKFFYLTRYAFRKTALAPAEV